MVEKAAGGHNTTTVLEAFAAKLEAQIDSAYSSQKASWVKCANIETAVSLDPIEPKRSPYMFESWTNIQRLLAHCHGLKTPMLSTASTS